MTLRDDVTQSHQILDLKGAAKAEQNDLLDSFLTITSTKTDLKDASFLSSLDMDPGQVTNLISPAASRVSLLQGSGQSDGLLAALASPPAAGSSTGSDTPPRTDQAPRREVFSDFKRFVSFGLRRESMPPS